MAVERDFKIVRTVERLNRIIHESRLTTRFVSLFYGEIEDDGNLMYVNAGHPHPLHFHGMNVTPLVQTGLVLGPTANATYSRGYRRIEPGDAVVLYTDGMVEAHGENGEEFGPGRLTRAFLELRERPCDEIARELISKVDEWSGGGDPEDDRTVVVLKRHFGPAPAARTAAPASGAYPVPPAAGLDAVWTGRAAQPQALCRLRKNSAVFFRPSASRVQGGRPKSLRTSEPSRTLRFCSPAGAATWGGVAV